MNPVRRKWWVRPAIVAALVVLLEVVTFWGYLTGTMSPQWDFFSHYNTEAMAWWRDGSFFAPTQWMDYAWGGYPSVLDVQNSSWYLPVGIASAFGTFTIQASAVLAALHVAFGAIGVFLVARSWRISFVPALLGLVAWFYVAGFYANAQHLDIARSYAWLPWIVLVISPTWRFDRWWRWLAAGLILWQSILAIYPGILIACVYALGAYVIVNQVVYRPKVRAYLLPLAVTAGAAVAMALLRYLPLYLTRSASSPSSSDGSIFSAQMIGTFLYPYGADILENDISMRSFFVAAPIIALLAFAPWRSRRLLAVLPLVVVAVVIGIPALPWHNALRVLPGMSLSRFTMSDFKPFLLLGLVLVAVLAAERISRFDVVGKVTDAVRRPSRITWIVTGGVVALFLMVGIIGSFDKLGWVTQFAFLVAAVLAIAAVATRRLQAAAAVVALVAIALGSGLTAQLATPVTWANNRPGLEVATFGQSVDSLIAEGDAREATLATRTQRPARIAPAEPLVSRADWEGQAFYAGWGRVFYTRELSLEGYVNIKGADSFEKINRDLYDDPTTVTDALAFWSAPGILLRGSTDALPTAGDVTACVTDGDCGAKFEQTPVSYASGALTYHVTADVRMRLVANEAWYRGWSASACSTTDPSDCRALTTSEGEHGEMTFTVPAGDWTVSMTYALPAFRYALVAFWFGLAVLVGAGVLVEFLRRRRSGMGEHGRRAGTESPAE